MKEKSFNKDNMKDLFGKEVDYRKMGEEINNKSNKEEATFSSTNDLKKNKETYHVDAGECLVVVAQKSKKAVMYWGTKKESYVDIVDIISVAYIEDIIKSKKLDVSVKFAYMPEKEDKTIEVFPGKDTEATFGVVINEDVVSQEGDKKVYEVRVQQFLLNTLDKKNYTVTEEKPVRVYEGNQELE